MPEPENDTATKITWSSRDPYVKRCLKFIRRKGEITVEQLVQWDDRNERRLFSWDDAAAAKLRRLDEARRFLNSFSRLVETFRVKAYIGMPQPEHPSKRVYLPTDKVHDMPGVRELLIDRLTRKMEGIASELGFWNLDEARRRNILNTLDVKMTGEWKE